jgi:hypothetical protein
VIRERSGDLRSRLLGTFVPLPYIHIGQHWHPDPRPRWNTLMSSRFSVSLELASRFLQDWLPAQHGTLRGTSCGFYSLEWF